MGIRQQFWTPEEDAKLLTVIMTMRGAPYKAIARAALEVLDRPIHGIASRIRAVDELREAALPPPQEPTVEIKPAANRDENPWGVTVPPLPFALPACNREDSRPYDRRATLYAKSPARAESPADLLKRILREEMRT